MSGLTSLLHLSFGLLIAKLSIKIVKNLLSKNQLMNGSFDRYRLVNTYGAFGVVTEERVELVVSCSNDVNGPWEEVRRGKERRDEADKQRLGRGETYDVEPTYEMRLSYQSL